MNNKTENYIRKVNYVEICFIDNHSLILLNCSLLFEENFVSIHDKNDDKYYKINLKNVEYFEYKF